MVEVTQKEVGAALRCRPWIARYLYVDDAISIRAATEEDAAGLPSVFRR